MRRILSVDVIQEHSYTAVQGIDGICLQAIESSAAYCSL